MPVNVYVYFNGNCRDAVNFYADIFETGEPKIMTFGEVAIDPEFPIPDDAKNLIIHATLNIKGSTVMFSDIFPGTDYRPGNNVNLTVLSKSLDEILGIYNKLKEDGTVDMELQETFFSKYYGSVTDKYGIPWQLSYDET
jgi:PhnB protein